MEYETRANMKDTEVYEKAVKRARANGVDVMNYTDTVIFLEKEIDMYRDKIAKLLDEKEEMKISLNAIYSTSQLEAAQENTKAGGIIKALADNGYNTITINCYKDIGKELSE